MKKYLNSNISCFVNAILVVLILLASSCSSNWKLAYINNKEYFGLNAEAGEMETKNSNSSVNVSNKEKKEYSTVEDDPTYEESDLNSDLVTNMQGEVIGEIRLKQITVVGVTEIPPVIDSTGKVEFNMIVKVPKDIITPKWQLRLHPRMYIRQNKVETFNFPLEDLYITGSYYRDKQIKGYERYSDYLAKIAANNQSFNNSINLGKVLDTTVSDFVNKYQLEYFIMRNFPEIYSMKSDTANISDEEFAAIIGHDKDKVIGHYYSSIQEKKNSKLLKEKRENFKEWVYNPLVKENIHDDNIVLSDTLNRFDKIYTKVIENIKSDTALSKNYYEHLDSTRKNSAYPFKQDNRYNFPEFKSEWFRLLDSANFVNESKASESITPETSKPKKNIFSFKFSDLKSKKFKLDKDNVILGEDSSNIFMEFQYKADIKAYDYPRIDRVSIGITGEVFNDTSHLHDFVMGKRINYPITSTASFADTTEIVYDRTAVLRKANHGANYSIEFEKNSAVLKEGYGNNASVIADIKKNIEALLKNAEFDLDSIIVSATASPEGAINVNERFSGQRSLAVSQYFKNYIESNKWKYKQRQDSLTKEHLEGIASVENLRQELISKQNRSLEEDNYITELSGMIDSLNRILRTIKAPDIDFKDYPIAENWNDLNILVSNDEKMTNAEKNLFFDNWDKYSNLDARENAMKKHSYYDYMSKELYPKIRVVKFEFHMHRKGQEHDTMWIYTPSEKYKEGVTALRNFDFITAENILKNYPSYNSAICFIVRNKPLQAINILEDPSLRVDFEKYKNKRDSLTLLYVSEDSLYIPMRDNIKGKIQVIKDTMDRAAKIEFLKAKAYTMRALREQETKYWDKALESYLFLLKMDALNGMYNTAITGEADIRGAVFGSSKYFEFTSKSDEYLQFLPRVVNGNVDFAQKIEEYQNEITLQMKKEEVKYYNEEKMQAYLEEREAWSSWGYSNDIVDQIIFLGIDPPEIQY